MILDLLKWPELEKKKPCCQELKIEIPVTKKIQIWETFACSVNIAFVSAAELLLSQMRRPPSACAAGAQV